MKLRNLAIFIMLISPAVISAQYVAGATVTIQADHDGIFTDFYDLILDSNIVQTLPVSALVNSTISFPLTLPLRGSHTIVVRARNLDDLFTDSDALTFTTGRGKPNKPAKPIIVPNK